MSDEIHADRRDPETPAGAIDLAEFADDLLQEARGLNSGRSARSLTPQVGAALKQTLMALTEGRSLDEHRTPGQATIQVLRGSVTLTAGDQQLELAAGSWAVIPAQEHGLEANSDAVVLLTVGATADG